MPKRALTVVLDQFADRVTKIRPENPFFNDQDPKDLEVEGLVMDIAICALFVKIAEEVDGTIIFSDPFRRGQPFEGPSGEVPLFDQQFYILDREQVDTNLVLELVYFAFTYFGGGGIVLRGDKPNLTNGEPLSNNHEIIAYITAAFDWNQIVLCVNDDHFNRLRMDW